MSKAIDRNISNKIQAPSKSITGGNVGNINFDNNTGPVNIRHVSSGIPRNSIIGRLVEIIASGNCEEISLERIPSEIEQKIKFNDLNSHIWIVETYLKSSILIDESIKELNKLILNGSTKLKRQMNIFYRTALAKNNISANPFDLERLRLYSDQITTDVMEQTKDFIKDSSNIGEGFYAEDIEIGVGLIVSYSIIECVVLENEYAHS